jgi:hypothetical protein
MSIHMLFEYNWKPTRILATRAIGYFLNFYQMLKAPSNILGLETKENKSKRWNTLITTLEW